MVTEVIKKEGQKMISGNEIMFLRKMAGYKSQAALIVFEGKTPRSFRVLARLLKAAKP